MRRGAELLARLAAGEPGARWSAAEWARELDDFDLWWLTLDSGPVEEAARRGGLRGAERDAAAGALREVLRAERRRRRGGYRCPA